MRTHLCASIDSAEVSNTLKVSGWVDTIRDHGGVIFIDLRDHSGVLQIVIDPDQPEAFAKAEKLRVESVISVGGRVRLRPQGTVNEQLPSGEVELFADTLEVHNLAKALPFQLSDEVSEEVRLKHRFLDLRRTPMQLVLRLRAKVIQNLRHYLERDDFVEVETPMLTRSTPEGARDYLVPSRVHNEQFFCLATIASIV